MKHIVERLIEAGLRIPPTTGQALVDRAVIEDSARLLEKLDVWARDAAKSIQEWALDEKNDIMSMPGCRAIVESCPVNFLDHKSASKPTDEEIQAWEEYMPVERYREEGSQDPPMWFRSWFGYTQGEAA